MRTDNPTARWIIVLAGVMFLGTLAALVVLAVSDTSTATLERLAGPLLTAVIVTGVLGVTHAQTGRRVDEVEKSIREDTAEIPKYRDKGSGDNGST